MNVNTKQGKSGTDAPKPSVRVKIGHAATPLGWAKANLCGIGAARILPIQGVTNADLRRMRVPVVYCRGEDFDGAASFRDF